MNHICYDLPRSSLEPATSLSTKTAPLPYRILRLPRLNMLSKLLAEEVEHLLDYNIYISVAILLALSPLASE